MEESRIVILVVCFLTIIIGLVVYGNSISSESESPVKTESMTSTNPYSNPSPSQQDKNNSDGTTQEQYERMLFERNSAMNQDVDGDLIYKLNDLQNSSLFSNSRSDTDNESGKQKRVKTIINDGTLRMMQDMIRHEKDKSDELAYESIVKPYHDSENTAHSIRAFFRVPSTSNYPDYTQFSKVLSNDVMNCKTNSNDCI
jgi:hypothetical protein